LNKTSFPVIQFLSTFSRRVRYSLFFLLGLSLFAAGSLLFSMATTEASPRKVSQRVQKKRPATKRRANVRRDTRKSAPQQARTTVVPAKVDAPGIGEEGEGEKVDERQRWFMMQRAYPYDTPPAEGRFKAYLARPRDARRGKDGVNAYAVEQMWRSIGPSPTTPAFPNNWGLTSGRINSIAVHPTNPQIVLVGASTGGVWRSSDGGTNFSPVSDNHVDLAVGSIAFSKSDPSIVYAGMGDLGNGYFGTGVLKSTDAGATWARVSNNSLPPLGTTAEIEVDPTNPNRVYVLQATRTMATSYNNLNPDGNLYRNGFYLSEDGGVNWRRTLAGRPRELSVHPANPQILYIGMNLVDPLGSVPAGPAGLYKSLDGGATWLPAPVFIAPSGTTTSDVCVAVTPASPENVYVVSGTRTAISLAVSNDGGLTWTTKPLTGVDPGQFGYNSYIHVAPNSAETIYVGTRDIYKTGDGGGSWTNLTKNFTSNDFRYNPFNSTSHPDQHALAFHPANSNVIYIGNDGGISLSSDGGASFVSLNASLKLTQFVGISMHPTDPNISYGGTQDNGTQFRLPDGKGWQEFAEGDGGQSVVNPLDPRSVFTTYVYGRIRRWQFNADGTRSERPGAASNSTFEEPTTGQRIAFYAPFKNNAVDSTVYFGTYRLFVSTNFADAVNVTSPTWTAPGGTTDLTRGGEANVNCTLTPKPSECFDVLSAIGVERKANAQVIYTGSARGRVMVTQNGGADWTERNLPLGTETIGPLAGQTRFRFIESITVDPSNSAIAYVTLGGFGSGHVFRTTNFGASWTDIGGTPGQPNAIPNVPVSAFLIDPRTPTILYAGSDIGVFRSTDNGATWATFNNGMLPAVVTGFATNNNGAIQLSTYGRGAYELVTSVVEPTTYTISGQVTFGGTGLSGVTMILNAGQSGAPTVITDGNGNYSFANVAAGGNYILSASKPNFNFSPQPVIFNNLGANQTANFTAATACIYSVSPLSPPNFSASGGAGSFQITTGAGCAWSATSLVPWITITNGSGVGNGTITFSVAPNTGLARNGQILYTDDSFYTISQTASASPAIVEFSAANYSFSEGAGRATITVTRSGNTSGAVSVDVATVDDPAAVPCSTNNGTAYARCDYATSIETVTFAAGDTQPKSISVPLIDDSHVEQSEMLQLRLLNPSNAATGAQTTATLTITDNGDTAGAANPILQTPLFVRMQYLDFLSREPETGEPWSAVLNNCSNVNNNPACDRITVSKAFFESQEFRLKGFYVFNFYRVAFNRLPDYVEVIPDMRSVTGQTPAEVYSKRAAFPSNFTGRPEFKNLYDAQSNTGFVNTLLDRYGLQQITTNDPANPEGGTKMTLTRTDLINRLGNLGTLGNQTLTRGQALRAIVESNEIGAAEFNRAYVAMQYYGYLRRTPESGGYNNWLTYLNANPTDARTMVNGFMNSTEYRVRFGQ